MKINVTLALLILGASFAPIAASAQDCGCAIPMSNAASPVSIISAAGDVRVLQSTGFAMGTPGYGLPVGSRVIVGQQSSAVIGVGDRCNVTVPAGGAAGVSSFDDKICVRLLDSTSTAQTNATDEQRRRNLLLAGGGIVLVGGVAVIIATQSGNGVSK